MPSVPLPEWYPKSVVFIMATETAGREPLGTGFLVGLPAGDPEGAFLYVVTAAHVVRSSAPTFVRLRKKDRTVHDLPVDGWFFHPSEDIAVYPIVLEPSHDQSYIPMTSASDVSEWSPSLGDQVYFIGLLGQVPSMASSNTPMVRSGSLGALYQHHVPMRVPDDTLIHVTGHLIDCRSFGGFSGSPCLVQFMRLAGKTERLGLSRLVEPTLLLGMVGGHFDLRTSVSLPDSESKARVPVAAGIAIVYPVELIREALNVEELVRIRQADNAEYQKPKADRRPQGGVP